MTVNLTAYRQAEVALLQQMMEVRRVTTNDSDGAPRKILLENTPTFTQPRFLPRIGYSSKR